MAKYIINGNRPLNGECRVQGAKNSALPIMAAALLPEGESCLYGVPRIADTAATEKILRGLGCRVRREDDALFVDSAGAAGSEIPDALMRELRSSVIFLGAILARCGAVSLSAPGGCEIGLRPIDLHLDAMRKLGAAVEETAGRIDCRAPEGLAGAPIRLSFPSVGATENIMIAAAGAKGETVIYNAAREPEISDLADFLNRMGARVSGAGESTIRIEGVKKLRPASHRVIPDRIAAGTLLAMAAATGGHIRLREVVPAHLGPVIDGFTEAGCTVTEREHSIELTAPARLRAVRHVRTMPYPGFPTDMQAPFTAMLTLASGTSMVTETIFESRFKYIGELTRFGARIHTDGRMAVVEGVPALCGADAITPDLRGGAALLLAALAAKGESEVRCAELIDRGYETIDATLQGLSADIRREDDSETA